MKDTLGKPKLGLLSFKSLSLCAFVREFGDSKYEPDNWKLVDPALLIDAALRHIYQHCSGSTLDKESGYPHLAHAATSLLLAIENIKFN